MGVSRYFSIGIPRTLIDRRFVGPSHLTRTHDLPGEADANRGIARQRLKDEAVSGDAPAHHASVPVVVSQGCAIVAVSWIPAHHPVKLPLQHKGSIQMELILFVVSNDPTAPLNQLMGTLADSRLWVPRSSVMRPGDACGSPHDGPWSSPGHEVRLAKVLIRSTMTCSAPTGTRFDGWGEDVWVDPLRTRNAAPARGPDRKGESHWPERPKARRGRPRDVRRGVLPMP